MRLVIGGYAQGKLEYVLRQEWARDCAVWDAALPKQAEREKRTIVINDFQRWVRETLESGGNPEAEAAAFAEACPECVIISEEIGNGIVPADAFEREYRERTGRILIELAGRAEEVVRVICGIGQRIR